jgi:uncharacterized membrane protein YgcG
MNREEAAIAGTATGLAIFFYAASAGLAALSRKRVELVRLRSLQWLIPILAYLVAAIVLIGMNPFQLSLFLLSGIALLGFGAFLDVLRTAMCRDGREKIALKKKLASARRYFARQLKLAKPQLKDEWLPYLIAFGLGPGVDRWFRAHGAFSRGGSHSEYESSGSSAGGWTGGGGKFGGGGATGSWTAAVGQIASGVSDSSSDGGSGGGGGGSSGGGGGGGW